MSERGRDGCVKHVRTYYIWNNFTVTPAISAKNGFFIFKFESNKAIDFRSKIQQHTQLNRQWIVFTISLNMEHIHI